ncbi:hypothetical protein BDZ45DRAFT_777627 [Acephala macrosclerotiorum]|nr:hypothetical protein BDZ45DRAFT_777627 [Acephala macrosclerotiorum]
MPFIKPGAVESRLHQIAKKSNPLENFTLFPTLPTELRLKIWDQIIAHPRIIETSWRNGNWFIKALPPVTTQICSESRNHAKKKHHLFDFCNLTDSRDQIMSCEHWRETCTLTVINYDVDLVYFSLSGYCNIEEGNGEIYDLLKSAQSSMLACVQHLAFDMDCFLPVILWRRFTKARNLKTINLAVEDICNQRCLTMNGLKAPQSMVIGYKERSTRFFKYDRWDMKHNMRLEIVNFG